ncbi:hypothetical protein [Proteus mirabilis]|uniref:hypothetical protein n=1 Tax=Proteus mirabilis TaxID=584 RepID=UPI0013D3E141|nr:hypothetical protein [Proteus mirabilis]
MQCHSTTAHARAHVHRHARAHVHRHARARARTHEHGRPHDGAPRGHCGRACGCSCLIVLQLLRVFDNL